jgi:hypothetical protein
MNTQFRITMECRQEKKNPVITSYNVSKEQYDRIREVAQENSQKSTDKYPFMNKKGDR